MNENSDRRPQDFSRSRLPINQIFGSNDPRAATLLLTSKLNGGTLTPTPTHAQLQPSWKNIKPRPCAPCIKPHPPSNFHSPMDLSACSPPQTTPPLTPFQKPFPPPLGKPAGSSLWLSRETQFNKANEPQNLKSGVLSNQCYPMLPRVFAFPSH